jgi:hypothetical protein
MSNKKDFVRYPHDISAQITGETPEGTRLQLGEDALVYLRICGWEQGAIDRIACSDITLKNELDDLVSFPGSIYIGNPEDIREDMHAAIDKLFAAIYFNRKIIEEEDMKKVHRDECTLDDIVYKEEVIEDAKE